MAKNRTVQYRTCADFVPLPCHTFLACFSRKTYFWLKDECNHSWGLVEVPGMKESQLERVRNFGINIQPDQGRVCESGLGKVDQKFWQSCRKQNCLTIFRETAQNFAKLFTKTHLEESVANKREIFFSVYKGKAKGQCFRWPLNESKISKLKWFEIEF